MTGIVRGSELIVTEARVRTRHAAGWTLMSALGSPGTSLRRAALLEQLITTLTTGTGIGQALAIKDCDPSDPTIALLDAWATAGDVIGFYFDRIADEGYISSATEAGSILTLASLLGHSPQLSIAASTYIAYQLQPDPTDTAVILPAGLLNQSIPAVGQTAQTFQTAQALTARPSWGLMTPKLTRPLMARVRRLLTRPRPATRRMLRRARRAGSLPRRCGDQRAERDRAWVPPPADDRPGRSVRRSCPPLRLRRHPHRQRRRRVRGSRAQRRPLLRPRAALRGAGAVSPDRRSGRRQPGARRAVYRSPRSLGADDQRHPGAGAARPENQLYRIEIHQP